MDSEEILREVNHIEIRTSERRGIKSYALRNNVLDEGQKESVLKYFPTHAVQFRDEFTKPETLFGNDKPVIVEIGFGMGSSTEIIARERREYNYLCLEVYLQGFVRLLRSVGEQNLDNIKLMRFNAVDVLEH
ncbi:MAG: tRNA (guanosine(46)-N7)-methyltransferase TrmB, partial [Bullifex sp.]